MDNCIIVRLFNCCVKCQRNCKQSRSAGAPDREMHSTRVIWSSTQHISQVRRHTLSQHMKSAWWIATIEWRLIATRANSQENLSCELLLLCCAHSLACDDEDVGITWGMINLIMSQGMTKEGRNLMDDKTNGQSTSSRPLSAKRDNRMWILFEVVNGNVAIFMDWNRRSSSAGSQSARFVVNARFGRLVARLVACLTVFPPPPPPNQQQQLAVVARDLTFAGG